jgi:hypothetical protein
MSKRKLRVGDRIRIVGIPGEGDPDYCILPETVRVYKKLIERRRPVRIYRLDEYGQPWFTCKFKRRNGTWEWHSLAVFREDDNWIRIEKRRAASGGVSPLDPYPDG